MIFFVHREGRESSQNLLDERQNHHLVEKACLLQKPNSPFAELLLNSKLFLPSLFQASTDDDGDNDVK